METRVCLLFPLLLTAILSQEGAVAQLLVNSGCPVYGCKPTGSFSFPLNAKPSNVTLRWSRTISQPLPVERLLGVAGNDQNILVVARTENSSGYVSLDPSSGQTQWVDRTLVLPPLPIVDVWGAVLAADGRNIVRWEATGKLDHPIPFTYPSTLFSLNAADNDLFLMTTTEGELITYGSEDGICDASHFLHDQVEGVNGTFVSLTNPVISGHRVYMLTKFKPSNSAGIHQEQNTDVHRLYAIDIDPFVLPHIKIQWYYSFEKELEDPQTWRKIRHQKTQRPLRFRPRNTRDNTNTPSNGVPYQSNVAPDGFRVMTYNGVVYVTIATPAMCSTSFGGKFRHWCQEGEPPRMLWAFVDNGNTGNLSFAIKESLATMAINDNYLYDNTPNVKNFPKGYRIIDGKTERDATPSGNAVIWATGLDNDTILGINSSNGDVLIRQTVSSILNTPARITSKLMVTSIGNANSLIAKSDDILIVGISLSVDQLSPIKNVTGKTIQKSKSFIIALETCSGALSLLWKQAVPGNGDVLGQITGFKLAEGVSDASSGSKGGSGDVILGYAMSESGGTLFALGSS